jgi:hypothetical protein
VTNDDALRWYVASAAGRLSDRALVSAAQDALADRQRPRAAHGEIEEVEDGAAQHPRDAHRWGGLNPPPASPHVYEQFVSPT